jgi:hypothetical protein
VNVALSNMRKKLKSKESAPAEKEQTPDPSSPSAEQTIVNDVPK